MLNLKSILNSKHGDKQNKKKLEVRVKNKQYKIFNFFTIHYLEKEACANKE